MAELDHPAHMPEGLDEHVWQRLVQARRMKVESEQKVCVNCHVQIKYFLSNDTFDRSKLKNVRIRLAL